MKINPKCIGIISVIAILIICFLPWLFTSYSVINFTETGQIGDTIGGIMTPFIAIIAAALTFFAFWVQYKANEQQKEALDIQKKNAELERFENRFYELLRIHRQNVEGMKIGLLENYNVFKELFYELGNCKLLVNNIFDELTRKANNDADDNEKKQIAELYKTFDYNKRGNLAYQLFFYGNTFNNAFNILTQNFDMKPEETLPITQKINDFTLQFYDNWEQGYYSITDGKKNNNMHISYFQPFRGQNQILGHYFRHLWQTVNFIDKEDKIKLTQKEKYNYVKMLRVQLSDYEQMLLLYNALSDLGISWFGNGKDGLLAKYNLVKNIPLPISVNFGITKDDIYKALDKEVDEFIKKKNNDS
jgi:uncharacterized membrane protein